MKIKHQNPKMKSQLYENRKVKSENLKPKLKSQRKAGYQEQNMKKPKMKIENQDSKTQK